MDTCIIYNAAVRFLREGCPCTLRAVKFYLKKKSEAGYTAETSAQMFSAANFSQEDETVIC